MFIPREYQIIILVCNNRRTEIFEKLISYLLFRSWTSTGRRATGLRNSDFQ